MQQDVACSILRGKSIMLFLTICIPTAATIFLIFVKPTPLVDSEYDLQLLCIVSISYSTVITVVPSTLRIRTTVLKTAQGYVTSSALEGIPLDSDTALDY